MDYLEFNQVRTRIGVPRVSLTRILIIILVIFFKNGNGHGKLWVGRIGSLSTFREHTMPLNPGYVQHMARVDRMTSCLQEDEAN